MEKQVSSPQQQFNNNSPLGDSAFDDVEGKVMAPPPFQLTAGDETPLGDHPDSPEDESLIIEVREEVGIEAQSTVEVGNPGSGQNQNNSNNGNLGSQNDSAPSPPPRPGNMGRKDIAERWFIATKNSYLSTHDPIEKTTSSSDKNVERGSLFKTGKGVQKVETEYHLDMPFFLLTGKYLALNLISMEFQGLGLVAFETSNLKEISPDRGKEGLNPPTQNSKKRLGLAKRKGGLYRKKRGSLAKGKHIANVTPNSYLETYPDIHGEGDEDGYILVRVEFGNGSGGSSHGQYGFFKNDKIEFAAEKEPIAREKSGKKGDHVEGWFSHSPGIPYVCKKDNSNANLKVGDILWSYQRTERNTTQIKGLTKNFARAQSNSIGSDWVPVRPDKVKSSLEFTTLELEGLLPGNQFGIPKMENLSEIKCNKPAITNEDKSSLFSILDGGELTNVKVGKFVATLAKGTQLIVISEVGGLRGERETPWVRIRYQGSNYFIKKKRVNYLREWGQELQKRQQAYLTQGWKTGWMSTDGAINKTLDLKSGTFVEYLPETKQLFYKNENREYQTKIADSDLNFIGLFSKLGRGQGDPGETLGGANHLAQTGNSTLKELGQGIHEGVKDGLGEFDDLGWLYKEYWKSGNSPGLDGYPVWLNKVDRGGTWLNLLFPIWTTQDIIEKWKSGGKLEAGFEATETVADIFNNSAYVAYASTNKNRGGSIEADNENLSSRSDKVWAYGSAAAGAITAIKEVSLLIHNQKDEGAIEKWQHALGASSGGATMLRQLWYGAGWSRGFWQTMTGAVPGFDAANSALDGVKAYMDWKEASSKSFEAEGEARKMRIYDLPNIRGLGGWNENAWKEKRNTPSDVLMDDGSDFPDFHPKINFAISNESLIGTEDEGNRNFIHESIYKKKDTGGDKKKDLLVVELSQSGPVELDRNHIAKINRYGLLRRAFFSNAIGKETILKITTSIFNVIGDLLKIFPPLALAGVIVKAVSSGFRMFWNLIRSFFQFFADQDGKEMYEELRIDGEIEMTEDGKMVPNKSNQEKSRRATQAAGGLMQRIHEAPSKATIATNVGPNPIHPVDQTTAVDHLNEHGTIIKDLQILGVSGEQLRVFEKDPGALYEIIKGKLSN